MASASTGSQTRSGASSSSIRAAAQRWCCSARSKNATRGPVSTMAGIATEAGKMGRVRCEVGNAGIDHAAGTLHQPGQARLPAAPRRTVQDEAQPLLEQLSELAAAQRRLGFGPAIEIVRQIDGRLHGATPRNKTIKEYLRDGDQNRKAPRRARSVAWSRSAV